MLHRLIAVFFSVCLYAQTPQPPARMQARDLIEKDIPPMDGQKLTGSLAELVLPPGYSGRPHKHNYAIYAYVLEGSVITRLDDGPEMTYIKGQVFAETPGQLHAVFKNPSAKDPARVLVFHVGEKGKPVSTLLN